MARKREEPGADDLETPEKPKGAPERKKRKTASKKPSKGDVDAQESINDAVPARTKGNAKNEVADMRAITADNVHVNMTDRSLALRRAVPDFDENALIQKIHHYLDELKKVVSEENALAFPDAKKMLRAIASDISKSAKHLKEHESPLANDGISAFGSLEPIFTKRMPASGESRAEISSLMDELLSELDTHFEMILPLLQGFYEKGPEMFATIQAHKDNPQGEKYIIWNGDTLQGFLEILKTLRKTFEKFNLEQYLNPETRTAHQDFKREFRKSLGSTVPEAKADEKIDEKYYLRLASQMNQFPSSKVPEKDKEELKELIRLCLEVNCMHLANSVAGQKITPVFSFLSEIKQNPPIEEQRKWYSKNVKNYPFFSDEAEALSYFIILFDMILRGILASQQLVRLLRDNKKASIKR